MGSFISGGLQTRSVRSGSRAPCISPGSSRTVAWIPEQKLSGGALESPARPCARRRTCGDHPATVRTQLANSPTFAKLPRAGEPRRSGPHHRGREGEAVRTRALRRPGEPAGAARGLGLAARGARQPTRRGAARGARLGGAWGRWGREPSPPPVAAVRWPSPAPRLASGGSAAELERGRRRGRFSSLSCCRRRADGRTRGAGGRRGEAGGTRRG